MATTPIKTPVKLHSRGYGSDMLSRYCTVTEVKDGRVVGVHCPLFPTAPGRPFNVKLHETPDGKGMFCTGSDSGSVRWYFSDIGREPAADTIN